MYKNKISKILFGIFIFMFASISVFAGSNKVSYDASLKRVDFEYDTGWVIPGLVPNCSLTKLICTHNYNSSKKYESVYINPVITNVNKSSCKNDTYTWASGYFDLKTLITKISAYANGNLTFRCTLGKMTYGENTKYTSMKSITIDTPKISSGNTSGSSSISTCGTNDKGWANGSECTRRGYKVVNGCCDTSQKTNSNGSSGSGGTGGSGGGNIPTTYSVTFNENGGYGLECNGGRWTVPSSGTCKLTGVKNNEEISTPGNPDNMYNDDGLLVGWTKTNCNKGNVIKVKSIKITSDSEYKACYRENIGENKYLQNGFLADGGTTEYQCGQSAFIEYCTRETSGDYCYFYENGQYRKVYRDKLANNDELGASAALATCNGSTSTNYNGWMYALDNGNNYTCGEALYINSCSDKGCTYSKISKFDGSEITDDGNIEKESLTNNNSDAKKTCDKLNISDNDRDCDNPKEKDNKGTGSYTVCYDYGSKESKIEDTIRDYYYCASGYEITDIYANSQKESCNDKKTICSNTYKVTCSRKEGKYKPSIDVVGGSIGSDGTGSITVTANSLEGDIVQYYVSQEYKTPTETTTGWSNTNGNKFTINGKTPGVHYVWVKDIQGNISPGMGGVVFDGVNTDTTINDLRLEDSNGNIQSPTGSTAYKFDKITSSSYVRLSNNLVKDSVIADNGFNPFNMEYKLEVSTPTISVYATLTSTDANYVSGYEPRTVNLEYGINTVLIKIQNKEGKVRTYTILVTRKDDRTADNTLSDLSIDVGNIEFNSNKTEYKIEIPKSTNSVNVSAKIGSDKASYVSGYEPGSVIINSDTTVKLIKVKSETGSTRTYVLTFIKEGTDVIEDKTLRLRDLVIPGAYLPFEEEISNYSLSVGYETELINLEYLFNNENSSASIYIKRINDNEYKQISNRGIRLDVGENFIEIRVNNNGGESVYRLTIIRKEFGLDISNDTTLSDLKVLGYNIKYEPGKKEYTVKIKQEKSLVITAIPNSNRAEVFIRGNDELTGFSTVRVKVVAENGQFDTYSIDIKKDAFNKTIEIAAIIAGVVIILGSSCIIIIKNKNRIRKEYFEE